MKRWVFVAGLVTLMAMAVFWLWIQVFALSAIVRGGPGPPSLVLLHGYGSRAEDWLQFEGKIQVPAQTRVMFPQGPLRSPTGQRGWWWLHLEGYMPRDGAGLPDLSSSSPAGIEVASQLVRNLLKDVHDPIVLGGFSQGAMLSAEIAFQTDQKLAGLILLSGTPVNEEAWVARIPGRRRLPIFIAHGRQDGVLSFAAMERFQARSRAAGLDVTWFPYDGGHEIPDEVIQAVNAFLANLRL